MIERGKSFSQLVNGGKKSFYDILNLDDIRSIIVPAVQRDYTLGSSQEYLETLLFDISKSFLQNKLPDKNIVKVVRNWLYIILFMRGCYGINLKFISIIIIVRMT